MSGHDMTPERAFDDAFRHWQAHMPKLELTGDAGGMYRYLKLPYILEKVLPVLGDLGFTIWHETFSPNAGEVGVACHLKHEAGYMRRCHIVFPKPEKARNPVHAMGGHITYGRRYTLLALLGTTDGVDTDAVEEPEFQAPDGGKVDW